MFDLFKKDVQRWIEPGQVADPSQVTFVTTLKLLYRHLPLQAMLLFRLGSWFHQKRIPLMPGFFQRMIAIFYGLDIVIGAKIGGGLYVAHPIGTVIVPHDMGENCSVIANVTVGMRNKWEFPRIGNRVFIGAGARVLGGIEIGDGAAIGANAVVIEDVPPGVTVVGIPARIVNRKREKKPEEGEPQDEPVFT